MRPHTDPVKAEESPHGGPGEGEALAPGGQASDTIDAQTFRAYRNVCVWLGHFYALLSLWRWFFFQPEALRRVLTLESLVAMGLFYGSGLLSRRLAAWMGGLENFGLLLVGIALGNCVFLVAWLPGEVQLVNFILVVVTASVVFRSPWRFALSQVMCLGSALFAFGHWMGLGLIGGDLFILLSGFLISTIIWVFLSRLFTALADLQAKDRVLLRQRTRLVGDLRVALDNVRTLRGLIPICTYCKRVRDDAGFWQQVEAYVHARSEAKFSHGICPECTDRARAEVEAMKASWTPDHS